MNNQEIKKSIRELKLISFISLSICIVIFGGLLNVKAISVNDGRMPVLLSFKSDSESHFSYQDENDIREPMLVDKYKFNGYIYSLGDIIIIVGSLMFTIVLLIVATHEIRYRTYKNKPGSSK